MPKYSAILPAAGSSSRFGGKEKKPFAKLAGRAVWLHAAELFINRDDVCQTLLVIAPEDRELVERKFGANLAFLNIQLVDGGAERFESVANALAKLHDDAEFVAVHDAARPCLDGEHIDKVFAAAASSGAAIVATPVSDTLKRVSDAGVIDETVPRAGIWKAETPQVFRRDWLEEAYAKREQAGSDITDDAQLVEAVGHPVAVVDVGALNVKITRKQDMRLAEAVLKSRPEKPVQRAAHPFADEAQMWGGR